MATNYDTARHQYEHYRWAHDNGHSDWVAKAATCFDFWNGEQWTPRDRAALEHAGRPAMTFNIIESLVRALEGMQCALRNDVKFLPLGDADVHSARVMDMIWLHLQNQNMFDFLETDVYKKGLIMGRAFYDVRVDYDEEHIGHVKITSPRSQDVILDPTIESYDPCDWPRVFRRRFVSYNDVAHMYGKEKAQHLKHNAIPDWYDYEDRFMAQQMGQLPYYRHTMPADDKSIRGHLLLEQQYHVYKMKDVFVDLDTGDISEIPENWGHNKISRVIEQTPGLGTMRKEMKTVRWTVTSEGEVMHDEDSPYDTFTIVPYFPSFIDGVTMGAVSSLLDPQQLYNKVSSQELHIINTTANSGYKVKRGALLNMSIEEAEQVGSRSGVIFELDDIGNLEKIQPNQVPQGHDRISFKADQIMRNIAGVSDQGRGFAREDVAGKSILANQAAQEINSAGWLNNLHRSKQLLARKVLSCVQTFYTETRVIKINRGSAFKPVMEETTINQPTEEGTLLNDVTRGRYTSALIPSPSRTTMSESDFKMLLQMRELGVGIPDDLLLELSPASNKARIIDLLHGDSNERQAEAEAREAEAAAIEAEKAVATARKEESAALLNQARAEKAAVEAMQDPDAAYREIEQARIGVDRERMMGEFALRERELENEENFHQDEIAVQLAKMDNDRETAVAVAKEKPASPQRDKKPGTTKR